MQAVKGSLHDVEIFQDRCVGSAVADLVRDGMHGRAELSSA
jgi:hypothetical protein